MQKIPFEIPCRDRLLNIAPVTPIDPAIAGANTVIALMVNNRTANAESQTGEAEAEEWIS